MGETVAGRTGRTGLAGSDWKMIGWYGHDSSDVCRITNSTPENVRHGSRVLLAPDGFPDGSLHGREPWRLEDPMGSFEKRGTDDGWNTCTHHWF